MNRIIKLKILLLALVITSNCFSQITVLESLKLKEKTIAFFRQKEYENAQEFGSRYLKINPFDYETTFLMGQTAYHLKEWDKAIGYYYLCIANGFKTAEAKYNIACCYALKNNKNEAVKWLQSAIEELPAFYYQWMEDSDLKSLTNDSIYFNEVHNYDRNVTNRKSQWKADIDFFSDRMKQFHFNLFWKITEKQWDENVNELKSDVDHLDDPSIIVRLMKMAALVGDGHTVLIPPISGKFQFRMSPYLSYIFDEEFYVVETHKDYQQILGSKIVAINDVPINEVLKRLKTIIPADNEMGIKWLAPLAISIPEILYGLDIIEDIDGFSLTYIKNRETITIKMKNMEKLTGDFLESWLYGFHDIKDWVKLKQSKIPTSQLKAQEPYWFEYLSKEELVVFHYNQTKTNEKESEHQFIDRLNQFIQVNDVEALVINLRYNEGGDNTIYRPILNGIISNKKINKQGKLFVIIGRRTFSAGMCFAVEMEKSTNAIFVGEPTGSSPNFVGESGGVFYLPYSKLFVNASNLYWQNSYAFDKRKYITPEIYIPTRFDNFKDGIDAPLEAIKQILNK